MRKVVHAMVAVSWLGLHAWGDIDTEGLTRTEWAPKLPGGALRTVFVGPYSALQDAHELMIRFDIDGTAVPVATASKFREFGLGGHYWPDLMKGDDEVLNDLRKALAGDWEVLAMSAYPAWSKYPHDIRTGIIAAVAQGRALVIPNPKVLTKDLEAAGVTLESMTADEIPAPIANPEKADGAVYRCGKGRVVQLSISNDGRWGYLLSRSALQADFEHSTAWAAWYLRLAARPEAIDAIKGTRVENGTLNIALDTAAAEGARIDVRLRRHDTYDTVLHRELPVENAESVSIDLPQLPTGTYLTEVRAVRPDGTVLDWDAFMFPVEGPLTIAQVAAGPSSAKVGDEVTVTLKTEGATENLTAVARWFDQWNRLLLETARAPFTGTITLPAPAGSQSVINTVEIQLASERGAEAVGRVDVLMPDNVPPTDFYVLYWNTGVGASWRRQLYYDVLRRKGLGDAFSNCGINRGTARAAALVHMRTVPYTTAFHGVTLADKLLNEEWLGKTEKRARDTAKAHRPYNTLAYTLGDENYVTAFKPEGRFCDTPEAWSMFQNFLRTLYADLDSLNAQWETAFENWESIRFDSEKEMLPSLDNPSAWTDYRMFVARQFSDAHQRMRRAIREEHPGAIVGWDGTEQYSSYDGYDWWQYTRDMDLIQVYGRYIIPGIYSNKIFNGQAVKSFRPNTPLSGAWMNSADRNYGGMYDPWYLLVNGWNSVWWWHSTFLHPANGACRWNLELTPIVEATVTSVREIKNGPGTLLSRAQKVIDPIAVHYSANNWHASTIESGVGSHINNLGLKYEFWTAPNLSGRLVGDEDMKELWGDIAPKGHYAAASKNVYILLHDLGFQPRTVARQEIEMDVLDEAGIKVLFLPFVVSLSDKEVERIKAFVENGGLLIADYHCGLRDLHCRRRDTAALDELFGIERNGTNVVNSPGSLTAEYGWRGPGMRFRSRFHEPVSPAGAKPYGWHEDGTPAVLVHSFGKGRTVYLNSDLYRYELMRRHGVEGDIREYLRNLLRDLAETEAAVVPELESGGPAAHIEVTQLTDGAQTYYGILPDHAVDDKSPRNVRIEFPDKRHIYDVRRRQYLGHTNTVNQVLHPGHAELFAALPGKTTALKVTAPERVRRGQPVQAHVTVDTADGNPGTHAAQVRVTWPDGTKPEYLQRTLAMPAGTGQFEFVPALNAPTGTWRLSAVDAVSGKTADVAIDVE
ncbi:MAG: beta-galactosidase trimerization domain-containing protein [Candidatus Pacebacteria bacterium]|nr:beta-galactosidase trimerization domain-containing protein [Candidatus Paceibacterota bacterium]